MADKKSSIKNKIKLIKSDGTTEQKIQEVSMNSSSSASFFSIKIADQPIATLSKRGSKNFSLKFNKRKLFLLSFEEDFKSSEIFHIIESIGFSWSGDYSIFLAEDNTQQLVLTLNIRSLSSPIKITFSAVSITIEYNGKSYIGSINKEELRRINPGIQDDKIVQNFELSTTFFENMIDGENNTVIAGEKIPQYLFGKYFDLLEQEEDLKFFSKEIGQYKLLSYDFSHTRYSFALIKNDKGKQLPYIYHKGVFRQISELKIFKQGELYFLLAKINRTNKYIKLPLPADSSARDLFLSEFEANVKKIDFPSEKPENAADEDFIYNGERKYIEVKDSTTTEEYIEEISSPKFTLYESFREAGSSDESASSESVSSDGTVSVGSGSSDGTASIESSSGDESASVESSSGDESTSVESSSGDESTSSGSISSEERTTRETTTSPTPVFSGKATNSNKKTNSKTMPSAQQRSDTKIKIDVKSFAETFMPLFSFFMFIGAALTGGVGFLVFAVLGAASSSVLTLVNGSEINIKHSIKKLENNKYSMFRQLDMDCEKAKENYKENIKEMESFLDKEEGSFGKKFIDCFSDFGLKKSSRNLSEKYMLSTGRAPSSELLERFSKIEKITDPSERATEIEKLKSELGEDSEVIDNLYDENTDFLDLDYNNIHKKVAHSLDEINNESFADKKYQLELNFVKTFLPGIESSFQSKLISYLEGRITLDDLMESKAFATLTDEGKTNKRTFFDSLKSSYASEDTPEGQQNVINKYLLSGNYKKDIDGAYEYFRKDLFDNPDSPEQIRSFKQQLTSLHSSGSKLIVNKELLAKLVREENITFLTQIFGNTEDEEISRLYMDEYADVLTQRFIMQKSNSKLPLNEFLKFLPKFMRERVRSLIIAKCEEIENSAQQVENILSESVSKEDSLNILKIYAEIFKNIEKASSLIKNLPANHVNLYKTMAREGKNTKEIIETLIITFDLDGILIKDILLSRIESESIEDLYDTAKNKELIKSLDTDMAKLKEETNLRLSAEERILSADVIKSAVENARKKEARPEEDNESDKKYSDNEKDLIKIKKIEEIYNKLITKLQEMLGNREEINNYEEFLNLISGLNDLSIDALASIGITSESLDITDEELQSFILFVKDKKILSKIQKFIKNSKGKNAVSIKRAWDKAQNSIKEIMSKAKNTATKKMDKKVEKTQEASSYKKDLKLKHIKQRANKIKEQQEAKRERDRRITESGREDARDVDRGAPPPAPERTEIPVERS